MTQASNNGELQDTSGRGRQEMPRDWLVYLGIGLLALLVRLAFLWEIKSTDVFGLLLGDAYTYDAWGQEIARGSWVGDQPFYQGPLYAYFLGVIYSALGHSVTAVRVVQVLLGSCSCVLLALAGRLFFGRRSGLIAGLLLALYPPAIFFDGTIQKAGLAGFLTAALLYVLARFVRKPVGVFGLLAGGLLGALALTREQTLVFVPVLLAWIAWSFRGRYRTARLASASILLAGLFAVLLPVTIRNAAVGGGVCLTTSFGPNFYIANHPGATGTYQPLRAGRGDPRYEQTDAAWLAEEALGRRLTPREVSSYWTSEALEYVRSQPGDWLCLMGKKLAMTFGATEIADTEDQYTYGKWSGVLRWLSALLHFGVILPLAAFGLVMTWRRRRDLALLYAMAGSYAVSLILGFVFARYRFPLVLFLLLFASAGLVAAKDFLGSGGSRRRLVVAVVAVVVAAVAANWRPTPKSSFIPVTHCNIAYALIEEGDRDGPAYEHLAEVLRTCPDYANAHHLMGVVLSNAGQLEQAQAHYHRAIELEPERALTYVHLGELLAVRGDVRRAVELYRKALELDPRDAVAHNNLGIALAGLGHYEEAAHQMQQAMELDPGLVDSRYNYGLVLAQSGQLEIAETAFREVLRSDPVHIGAHHNLASIYLLRGQAQRAIGELEQVLRQVPHELSALIRLAWLLATHEDATVRDGERAVRMARGVAQGTQNRDPQVLDALAAAYAETGRFDLAQQTAAEAHELAVGLGAESVAREISEHLELYRGRQPYRRSWP